MPEKRSGTRIVRAFLVIKLVYACFSFCVDLEFRITNVLKMFRAAVCVEIHMS